MRKLRFLTILFVVAAMATGCSKETVENRKDGKFIITARQEASVRTIHEGNAVKWTSGDCLGVFTFQRDVHEKYTASNISHDGTQADFTGNALPGEEEYFVYYPYQDGASPETSDDAFSIAGQTQTGNSNSHIGRYDFLYSAPQTFAQGTTQADVVLTHAFALQELTIKLKDATPDVKITSVTLRAHTPDGFLVEAFATGVYISESSGDLRPVSYNSEISLKVDGAPTLTTGDDFKAYMLMRCLTESDNAGIWKEYDVDVIVTTNKGRIVFENQKTGIDPTTPAFAPGSRNTKTLTLDMSTARLFPDANFRAALVNAYGFVETGGDIDLSHPTNAGKLSSLTALALSEKNIAELSGIEFFTALTDLDCSKNHLQSLDLSRNPLLTRLDCSSSYTNINKLDLSKNPAITTLICFSSRIGSLDVSGCPLLQVLLCYDNYLGDLDVSLCPALATLYCQNNSSLHMLDVSQNSKLKDLNCSGCQVAYLALNGTALEQLKCSGNSFQTLNIAGFTALKYMDCSTNQLTALDVSTCSALTDLNCSANGFSSLDISPLSGLLQLHAGKQNAGMLTLTLSTAQQTLWNSTWKSYPDNTEITLDVK